MKISPTALLAAVSALAFSQAPRLIAAASAINAAQPPLARSAPTNLKDPSVGPDAAAFDAAAFDAAVFDAAVFDAGALDAPFQAARKGRGASGERGSDGKKFAELHAIDDEGSARRFAGSHQQFVHKEAERKFEQASESKVFAPSFPAESAKLNGRIIDLSVHGGVDGGLDGGVDGGVHGGVDGGVQGSLEGGLEGGVDGRRSGGHSTGLGDRSAERSGLARIASGEVAGDESSAEGDRPGSDGDGGVWARSRSLGHRSILGSIAAVTGIAFVFSCLCCRRRREMLLPISSRDSYKRRALTRFSAHKMA